MDKNTTPPDEIEKSTNFKRPFIVCCRSEDTHFNCGGAVNVDIAV